MKEIRPTAGPINQYLAQIPEAERVRVVKAVQSLSGLPETAILIELLEKSVLHYVVPHAAPEGALEDQRAQSFLILDLLHIWDEGRFYDRRDITGDTRKRRT